MKIKIPLALLSLAVLLLASGCARRAYVETHYYGEEVPEAPPEPMIEEVPAPPAGEYVWVPGYWYWDGANHVWVSGVYRRPPVIGHVWVRSGWVYTGHRYRFVRGYWAPPTYRVHYHYVHPAPVVVRGRVYRSYRRR